MKKAIILLSLSLLLSFTSSLDCPDKELCVEVSTRYLKRVPSFSNLMYSIETAQQPQGYCQATNPLFPLNNRKICKGGQDRNIGWKFNFQFQDSEDGHYYFQMGVNFGYGALVYVDGKLAEYTEIDYYWDRSWTDDRGVIRLDGTYKAGIHYIEIYGAGCCDGQMDILYKLGSEGPEPFEDYTCPYGKVCKDVATVYINEITDVNFCNPQLFAEALKRNIETAIQPDTYCTTNDVVFPLSHSTICEIASPRDIGWKYRLHFNAEEKGTMLLRLKIHFQYGVAIYLNNEFQNSYQREMHWSNTSIVDFEIDYDIGRQEIIIYAEGGSGTEIQDILFENSKYDDQRIIKYNEGQYQPCTTIETKSLSYWDYLTSFKKDNFIGYFKQLIDNQRQTIGYCTIENANFPITNNILCGGSNSYVTYKLDFTFNFNDAGRLFFEFAADFDLGALVYIDDTIYSYYDKKLKWRQNWLDFDNILKVSFEFEKGTHVITIYGAGKKTTTPLDFRTRSNAVDSIQKKKLTCQENCEWNVLSQEKVCTLSTYDI